MTIFVEKEKKQQKILIVFILVLLFIAVLVFGFRFLKKEKSSLEEKIFSYTPQFIKVDFNKLENLALKNFDNFEKIAQFEGESGRENPFVSY